jgi:hypothetical protein
MTALSIAEAERRAGANPQVSGLRRGGIGAEGDLASVTELPVAARPSCEADPEIFRRAGVSRPAGVSRHAPAPARAGVSRVGRPAAVGAARAVRRAPVGELGAGRPAPAVVSRPVAGRVRLTARGRAVLASLAGAVIVCVCSMLAAGGAAAASHGSPAGGYRGMHQVVVEPGQTLWSIASAAEPTADPQAVIQEIMTANSLPGSIIHAGQVLWVPRG